MKIEYSVELRKKIEIKNKDELYSFIQNKLLQDYEIKAKIKDIQNYLDYKTSLLEKHDCIDYIVSAILEKYIKENKNAYIIKDTIEDQNTIVVLDWNEDKRG